MICHYFIWSFRTLCVAMAQLEVFACFHSLVSYGLVARRRAAGLD